MKPWRQLVDRLRGRKKPRQSAPSAEPAAEEEHAPNPAKTQKVALPEAQALVYDKVPLVFGLRWTPITPEQRMGTLLAEARKEGFFLYVTNGYQETVGLSRKTPRGMKKPHAAAKLLSQNFAQGGTELFVFEQDEQWALVGLVDYSPTPGFDAIGTAEEMQSLAEEFMALNSAQLIRVYGNTTWHQDCESLELPRLAKKAKNSDSALKPIPNRQLMGAIGAGAVLLLVAAYFAYDYYDEMVREQEAAILAVQNDPNLLYQGSLKKALANVEAPGNVRLHMWRKFFSVLPLMINGWSASAISCTAMQCEVRWTRVSGNFSDFEAGFSSAMHGSFNIKQDDNLKSASITSTHDMRKFSDEKEIKQTITPENLQPIGQIQKNWHSRLQDLTLLPGINVSMKPATLFGATDGVDISALAKPIVKGSWSIEHDAWSLPEWDFPKYVTPETLTLQINYSTGFRYKLEGGYYAKGK